PTGAGMIVADGGSPTGAGPGGNAVSEPCGDAVCALPGQLCCVYPNHTAPDFSFACAAGGCPSDCRPPARSPRTLRCSDTANCPAGRVCCIAQTQTMEVASTCKTACGPDEGQLCDPQAPV